jgi:UDP-N-acetylmuramoylalanine--D-glutamate ligase
MRALVYGMGIAGLAVAEALVRRGAEVLAADDATGESAASKRAAAETVGAVYVDPPVDVAALVQDCDLVCPAPGVPETHPLIAAADVAGVPLRTEIDLAYEWEQERPSGPRPMLAVTGTDGKTTTTLLAAEMVGAAGHRVRAVGNTDEPLIAALDSDAEVFVVECSSFRLNWLDSFRAEASVWLNLAADHQNWHRSLDAYAAAKARLWSHVRVTDVAVGFADDPVVLLRLRAVPAVQRTFALDNADYHVDGGTLAGPHGPIAEVAAMARQLPHDLTNALAASAIVLESGLADTAAVARALAAFRHPPHRIEPLGEHGGAQWFNDSKATTPHATLTALRGFERIVLLAGGLNKGLDLGELATEHQRVRAVVALGSAAADIEGAFAAHCEVRRVGSMAEAVAAAAALAHPGDTVLLSPACASFDWYPDGGYPARGEDFKRLVAEYFETRHLPTDRSAR